jgi:hypothetical protein
MIQLFKNGKLVDYGTKPDVSFYVRLGFDVKVLNAAEVKQFRAKVKCAKLYKSLNGILKKKVGMILTDSDLTWTERHDLALVELSNMALRAKRIHVVPRKPAAKEWTFTEQIQGVVKDIRSLFSSVFCIKQAWQLQLAHA